MNAALEALNYSGTFVHLYDGKAETMHVSHRFRDGEVHERIFSIDGVGREIIRRGDDVRCILPDQQVILFENGAESNPLVAALPSYSRTIEAHYELRMFSADRVADRPVQVVGIAPRDDFRYGYLLWLDSETAMPLRSRAWGDDKQTIEEILFTSIEFPDEIPDDAFEQTADTGGFRTLDSYEPANDSAPVPPWKVEYPPAGFELIATTRKSMADSAYPVEHLVYSDGLATVSVFVESPDTETEVTEGFSRVGSTNTYSLTMDGRKITAMGEVPRRTVEAIATSLRIRRD
jgi:sigma-E factor negative regulatory protein RseB